MPFGFLDVPPLADRELELVVPGDRYIDTMLIAAAHPDCRGDERAEATTRQALRDFLKLVPNGTYEDRETVTGSRGATGGIPAAQEEAGAPLAAAVSAAQGAGPEQVESPATAAGGRLSTLLTARAAARRTLRRGAAATSGARVPSYHFWMHLRHGPLGLLSAAEALTADLPPIPMAGSISLRIGNTPEVERYYGHIGYNVFPPARGRHYAERACRLVSVLARAHGLDRLWITCNPDNWASRRTCERLGARLVDEVDVPRSLPLYDRGEIRKCRYLWEIGGKAGTNDEV